MTDRGPCPDCGTPYHGAAGPFGVILVPTCWCADEKRKAEARVAWEAKKAGDSPEEKA